VAVLDAATQYFGLLDSIGVATARCHLRRPQQRLAMSTEFDSVAGYILVVSMFGLRSMRVIYDGCGGN
jgi:hypothetical protein